MENGNDNMKMAVLIDADNVSPKYIECILDEVAKIGTATFKRIYGDWTGGGKEGWKKILLENSINPIQQYSYTYGKNATDSAMIIDAMDILYGGGVNGFCIVSSDSDFTKLAQRLRESGCYVMGMGEEKTPVPFRRACDIFKILEKIYDVEKDIADKENIEKINTEDIKAGKKNGISSSVESTTKKTKTSKKDTTKDTSKDNIADEENNTGNSLKNVKKAIYEIINNNDNNDKKTGLGEVGSYLNKKYSDFDTRNFGYSKLSTFIEGMEEFTVTTEGRYTCVYEKKTDVSKSQIERDIISIIDLYGGKVTNLSFIHGELKKKYPKFNVKKYGYSRMSSFMNSFGKFKIVNNEISMKK